jgi:hypothetical protein
MACKVSSFVLVEGIPVFFLIPVNYGAKQRFDCILITWIEWYHENITSCELIYSLYIFNDRRRRDQYIIDLVLIPCPRRSGCVSPACWIRWCKLTLSIIILFEELFGTLFGSTTPQSFKLWWSVWMVLWNYIPTKIEVHKWQDPKYSRFCKVWGFRKITLNYML